MLTTNAVIMPKGAPSHQPTVPPREAPRNVKTRFTSWRGDVVLGIVRRIDVRHRKRTHGAHGNHGRSLHGGEVVRIRPHRPLFPRLPRLWLPPRVRAAPAHDDAALPD